MFKRYSNAKDGGSVIWSDRKPCLLMARDNKFLVICVGVLPTKQVHVLEGSVEKRVSVRSGAPTLAL